MSYNLKCCSFYPNNFDASALSNELVVVAFRSVCVCTSVGVHVYFGRCACVLRSVCDDNRAFFMKL